MSPTRKVFLSYRSVDRERVRPVAEALRTGHSIDAWWDTWEIKPGDNFVSKINEGLKLCECGIVFLSNASLAGAWQQDEITTLKVLAVEKKLPLIPVLLDPGIDIDPILLPYSRLSADQIPELAAAILNRAGYASPIRTPRGRDILAACGQLKSESEKVRASARRKASAADEAVSPDS